MEKYMEFIKENNNDHEERLRTLVKIAIPLIKECNDLYKKIGKYKKAHVLSARLNVAWSKCFKRVKHDPSTKSEKNLVVGRYYKYRPDNKSYWRHRIFNSDTTVKLIKIEIETKKDPINCDSIPTKGCDYLIEIQGILWAFQMWVRKECLVSFKQK